MDEGKTQTRAAEDDLQRRLSARLLERLRPIATDPGRPRRISGAWNCGQHLFSYNAFRTERVARVSTPNPFIGIILSGIKEFWLGDCGQRLTEGMVFVLPAGPEFEVVNIPDERRGLYESLFIEVSRVPPDCAGMPIRPFSATRMPDIRIRLTPELVDSLAHAAIVLRKSERGAALARYRLAEVLLLLRDEPAARPLFDTSLLDRLAWTILGAPARRWTVDDVGRELGLGGSTLRRHLADRGTSFREILAETRMSVAHRILTNGEGTVSDAAAAAGYASRSHFTRHFQRIYGALPREFRTRPAQSRP